MTATETRRADPRACPTCGLWQRTAQAAAVCPDQAHDAERAPNAPCSPPHWQQAETRREASDLKSIEITLSMDVDEATWRKEYGDHDMSVRALRDEIRRRVWAIVRTCNAATLGGITEVRWVR